MDSNQEGILSSSSSNTTPLKVRTQCTDISVCLNYYLGPPQGQGGYYPQQPQQAYQGGYSGQPGFQQQPQPQTVYVYVRPR